MAPNETTTPAEESLAAFRDALEKSVTISRERLEEVADDAVKRGRMTRRDAEEFVGKLINRGREQADGLLGEVEKVVSQLAGEAEAIRRDPLDRAGAAGRRAQREVTGARREVEAQAARARREVGKRASTVRKRTIKAVDEPLARADRARRKARAPGFPISAYDQLSVPQIAGRLTELTRDELRKIRSYERKNRGRKGVIRAVERELGDG